LAGSSPPLNMSTCYLTSRERNCLGGDTWAANSPVPKEDFELAPFFEKGGAAKVYQIFGSDLSQIIDELNEALAA
jgi:hypothetical protein